MGSEANSHALFSGAELEDEILDQLPTPVMSVDMDLKVTRMNVAGCALLGVTEEEIRGRSCAEVFNSAHCGTPDCRMRKAFEVGKPQTARNEVPVDGRVVPIEYTAAVLKDKDGNTIGGVEYILDITERVRHEQTLREQSETIREISTPAIKLWDGIVVLPVVGVVDSARAQQMMDAMLSKVTETSSRVIILDIQGVAALDTAVANHLIKITKATRLMGCQCVISGISPAVAQTLVHLGIELGDVETKATLKDALEHGFRLLRLEISKAR